MRNMKPVWTIILYKTKNLAEKKLYVLNACLECIDNNS